MNDLFDSDLLKRFAASQTADATTRAKAAGAVMGAANLPRLGTSGAANAFVVFVGSEFGSVSTEDRPHYSPHTMGEAGWNELWRLRIGEPNPHFALEWSRLLATTVMWQRLVDWLPDAFPSRSAAHSMFAWTNLSVTAGGAALGTAASHRAGMTNHVAPFIEAAHARIVVGTNDRVQAQLDRWALSLGATHRQIDDMTAWRVELPFGHSLVAKVGHPSRGVSRTDFTRRLRSLLRTVES